MRCSKSRKDLLVTGLIYLVVLVGRLLLDQSLIGSTLMRLTSLPRGFFATGTSLPALVKASESVTSFKSRLDTFRLSGYQANKLGHYWELSYDIFDRIDVSLDNRSNYQGNKKFKETRNWIFISIHYIFIIYTTLKVEFNNLMEYFKNLTLIQ